MRVLIAEDDPVSRRLLEKLFKKWGYDVVITRDGAEALRVLQSEDSPRLAILDWMMPELDGVDVCRQLRENGGGTYKYIILLTAKSQSQDVVDGLAAGADDYVTKPFDANELSARVRVGKRILDLQSELLTTRESLRMQATCDPLTGLPNRLLFSDRLTQQITQAARQRKSLSVIFLDLDRFKMINDTLGHNIGDMLLKSVGKRLTETLREVDTVARMGGDEFTIILPDVVSPDEAINVSNRILSVLSEPFHIENHELFVSASLGISMYPAHGTSAESLVRNADTAMYRAKLQGRNSYHIYTDALNAEAMERMTVERSLRSAIKRQELLLHYQPMVDIVTGRTLGAEALIRWQNPRFGLVPPAQFIPLAEDTGLIIPLGEWVLHAACRQAKRWQDLGLEPIKVSVNISPCQLNCHEFIDVLSEALSENDLDPQYLLLELTESTLMQNPSVAIELLNRVKSMGVGVSLDDFGTGYSSLSYLKRFPIDAVKIDRSFIGDITTNADDAAIAGAVVAMAHSLKLRVIAEGVETLDQLEFLKSLGCDETQGYFISQPLPADDFERHLRSLHRNAA